MAIKVATKVRVGFSLALVAFLAIGGSAGFTYIPVLQTHNAVICVSLGLASLLMWLTGALAQGEGTRLNLGGNPLPEQAAGEHPLACFKTLRHWGIILGVSAALVYAFNDYRSRPYVVHAATPRRSIPRPPLAVAFPPLKLQGLISDGDNSSAIINREVLRVGEGIGNVRVVAIDSAHVTVELEGQTKVLSLPD